MVMNLRGKCGRGVSSQWSIIYGVAIWRLWSWRNSALSEENFSRPLHPATSILYCWRHFSSGADRLAGGALDVELFNGGVRRVW